MTVDGKAAYSSQGNAGDGDSGQEEVGDTFSGDVSAGSSTTIIAASDDTAITTAGGGTDSEYVSGDPGANRLDINKDGSSSVDSELTSVGLSSDDTVRVIYDNPDSDSSSTLAKFTVQ